MKHTQLFIPPTFTTLMVLLLCGTARAQSMSMRMKKKQNSETENVFLVMMDAMMMKMDGAPKGNAPGTDFMLQMVPHHEGAIAMADYEIAHGRNFDMIQLAKSILAEQTSEVQQMNLCLRQASALGQPTPSGYQEAMDHTMSTMMDHLPANAELGHTDEAFAAVMIPHHQAAVDMAKVALKYAKDQQTCALARQIISEEEIEIEQMKTFLTK